jgi:Esterase/lipase
MSFGTFIFRKMCTKSDTKRDAGLEIPEDVEYIRDIRYGRDKKENILDICWPKTVEEKKGGLFGGLGKSEEKRPIDISKDKLPVIISVHGGAYVYGTKEVYQFYCASLAEKGFTVINFNYRLAPKHKFPTPLEDLNSVIKWMLANSKDYPIDTENVFMVGDSAGAQIACQYGAIYSDKDYRRIMDFKKPKMNLRALGFCCGSYNLKERIAKEGVKGALKDYLTKNPEKFGEKLDVLEHITEDFPPVYLFSGKGDFLMEECETMAEFLKSRNVKCKYKIYGNKKTGHVFHVNMRDEFGAEANSDQIEFFKDYIR